MKEQTTKPTKSRIQDSESGAVGVICHFCGHKEIERWDGGMFYTDTVLCGRCGDKSACDIEWEYGAIRTPIMRIKYWIERRIFILGCEYRKWKTRNEPPPF